MSAGSARYGWNMGTIMAKFQLDFRLNIKFGWDVGSILEWDVGSILAKFQLDFRLNV